MTLYVVPKTCRPGRKTPAGSSITKEIERKSADAPPLDKMPSVRMPLAGFVIAKKVSKSACKRNRAKRRIREAYRLIRHESPQFCQSLEQWYALVFVLHDKVLAASWEEIRTAVNSCLSKAAAKFGRQPS
jgi:ribonuclease P protein component